VPLSTIFLLGFGTSPTGWYFVFLILLHNNGSREVNQLFLKLPVMAKFSMRNAWFDFFFLSNNSVIRAPFNRIVKIPSTATIHPEI